METKLKKEYRRRSMEESSLIIAKRRRYRKSKCDEVLYIESSPNGKYSVQTLKHTVKSIITHIVD
jgi:hypothetical protein